MAVKVCFLGGTRYDQPLDATSEKKFRAMKRLGDLFVVGFSRTIHLRTFTEHAHFYLLPLLPMPPLRYLELFVFGQILLSWLIVRQGVRVVVAQSPYEGFIAALAIKFVRVLGYRARLVVEVHGDFESSLFLQREIRFAGLYRFLMSHVAQCSIRRADLLRAISVSTKEQLKKWAPGKTIVQFPAWTDIETFLQSGSRAKTEPPPQAVLYAGVLTPLKGIHHLINAVCLIVRDFPNADLFIVGRDENKTYTADLRKRVEKLGLERRVQFMGAMTQSELATWMAKTPVLVLPSMSEGLGRVVIEAMATGTPVIGSHVGGIPDLIKDGVRGFLIPPGDEKALAEKIRWIFHNPKEARAMGERARAFAARLFSTESYLQAYEQLFEMARLKGAQRENATPTF